MKKQIIIVSAVVSTLLLVGAGCFGSNAPSGQNQTSTPNTTTDITGLMNDIKSSSGLNFSSSEPSNFTWIIQNQKGVGGQTMQVGNVTDVQEKTVETYLRNQGFTPDPANSFLISTSTASVGYTRGATVCSITGELLNSTKTTTSTSTTPKYKLNVTCGNL